MLSAVALLAAACGDANRRMPTSPASARAEGPDLVVSGPRAASTARVVRELFEPGHCAIVEGCVGAPGWRRLLRFETFAGNVGTSDVRIGPPLAHPDLFEFSACHGHHHFAGFADYRLIGRNGREAGRGHKQAFCLEDSERLRNEPGVPEAPFYSCADQGISRGWGDSYPGSLDCQWVDVTDVPPGTYTLQISVNPERRIAESRFDNNVVSVRVNIPE